MLISRWFPPQRQAFLVGIVVTMAFIGGMLAHTPFAKLNALYGWRQALLIDAALGSIILLWIYTFVEDRPQGSAQEISQDNNSSMQGFVHALKNSQNWLAGLYTSFLNLPIMVFGALWGSNYLMSVFGVEKMAASTITANILLGSIIGCPLSGWLSDKSGKRKPIMIVGALSSLVLMIPLYQGISMSAFHLHLLFFFVGVSTSTQVVSYPLIAESNPSKYTGVATGLASVLIMGGAGVAQMIFSSVLQISASQHRIISSVSETSLHYSAVDYQKAALMFPIAFFLALLAVLRLKETNCKPQN